MTSPRLLRFQTPKPGNARAGSPSGGSIFTPSDPKSASIIAAIGPAMPLLKSTTRTPSSAMLMAGSASVEDDGLVAVQQDAVLDVPAHRAGKDHAFDVPPQAAKVLGVVAV